MTKYNTVWIQQTQPDNFDDPEHDLIYTRQAAGLPSIKTHIKNQCYKPWWALTIDYKDRIFTCNCDGHLPWPVGIVDNFNDFDEIFNSEQAITNQQSVKDQNFKFCATQYCGIESQSFGDRKNYISIGLGIDTSCNLQCPSCRERIIFINDKTMLDAKIKTAQRIASWVKKTDKIVEIIFAGGEPFASLVYMKIINLLKPFPNVRFVVRTNGLLIKRRFGEIDDILTRTRFSVSIDAASKSVYEQVRLGGKWEVLLENLEFLKTKKIFVSSSFVIQKDNINDIIPFIEFSKKYNMHPQFSVVSDWGTWTDYESHCVHLPTSPYYKKFCEIVQDPIWKENQIQIGSLRSWLPNEQT